MHIVALGYAEPIVTVGERFGLAGQYVPTTQIPGDESVANVDDRHFDFPAASLADPVLRSEGASGPVPRFADAGRCRVNPGTSCHQIHHQCALRFDSGTARGTSPTSSRSGVW